MQVAGRVLGANGDRAVLVALLVVAMLLPGTGVGIVGLGLVSGAVLALYAAAIVLVFSSTRVLNLAGVQVGVLAGVLFRLLVEQGAILRALEAVCPPCASDPGTGHLWLDYVGAAVVALACAALLSWGAYVLVVRRFASPLAATVVTIGIAQLFASVQSGLPALLATTEQRDTNVVPQGVAAPPPFDLTFSMGGVVFRAPAVLTVALAVVAALALAVFFRRSATGIAIRAAADDPNRATTVGIPVRSITGRVWMLAGGLAGAAGILHGMSAAAPEAGIDVTVLVRVLAVVVFARLTSLAVAAFAGLALGVFDQSLLWVTGTTSATDGLLLVVVAAVLAVQRARATRADEHPTGRWEGVRELRPVPAALAVLPGVRTWRRSGIALGVLAVLGLPWVLSGAQTNAATITLVYALIGVSLLVLTGWAGQISLGHFAFAAVGAWTAAVTAGWGVPMPVALLAGAGAGAALAVATGIPSLRLRGLELAVTTLAFALAASAVLVNPTYLGGLLPETLERPAFLEGERAFYYLVLVVLAVAVAAVLGLRHSRAARGMLAARDNEAAAQTFRIDVVRVRIVAFALSGGLAAFAGALFAFHQRGVRAASYGPEVSVLMFLMVVIGGLGSVAGPVLGALYVGLLDFFSDSALVTFLATGGGVVVVLLLAPGGLAGVAADVRDAFLRSTARRHGIAVPSLDARGRDDEDGKAPIAPLRAGGQSVFVPEHYRLDDPWKQDKVGERGK